MFKAYAKVLGEAVVKYPYGFDDLQADMQNLIAGDVSFVDLFAQSQAFAQGFRLVEVIKDERKTIPLPPGQMPVFSDVPMLVDDKWMLSLVGLENPPVRPNDGKFYHWNIETRQWIEIPAHHIPQR
jgi:hypothetical protein